MSTGNADKGINSPSKGSPSPLLIVLVMWLPGQVLALQRLQHPGEHPALTLISHLSR